MADDILSDQYVSPEVIKARTDLAKQRASFYGNSDPGNGRYSPFTGLLQGFGLGMGWQDQAAQQKHMEGNQRLTSDALKRASSAPNAASLSRLLIDSGIDPLANQGLGILASSQEKAADRAAQLDQQKQLFRFQKQETLDAEMRKRRQDIDMLRSLGAFPPPASGGPPASAGAVEQPATGAVHPNSEFADQLLADEAHKAPTPAQKAGIALVLGEKGKAADALMEKGGAKITEGQGKDASFAERMLRSEAGLREVVPTDKAGNFMKYDPTSSMYRFMPDWNVTNSTEWQQYSRNAREGIAAILRKDTGAAVSDTEWQWYFPMYYPQPGDAAQVVKDKQEARIAVARGLRGSSGPAFDQMFPRFNEQLRAKLLKSGADLTPKAPAGSQPAAGAGKYSQIRKNPKTGAMVGFNPTTNAWEPIQADAAAEQAPLSLGEIGTP